MIGLFPNLADEADTFARQGADQPLLFAIVADRGACRIDPAAQGRFRHDAPAPDRGHQIVAADHALARTDQELQEIEDLRLDRNEPIAAAQLATAGVEDEVIEIITAKL